MATSRTIVVISALACLQPAFAWAKDGHGSDDDSHAVVVAAAACSEAASVVSSARTGGAFSVRDGASTHLVCGLSTEDLARSSDDRKPVTFEIAYFDGDGPGPALVRVALVRTSLAADPDGFAESEACAWSSADGGPLIGTTAHLLCPGGIVEGGFYHLRVDLSSTQGGAASFMGVVARR